MPFKTLNFVIFWNVSFLHTDVWWPQNNSLFWSSTVMWLFACTESGFMRPIYIHTLKNNRAAITACNQLYFAVNAIKLFCNAHTVFVQRLVGMVTCRNCPAQIFKLFIFLLANTVAMISTKFMRHLFTTSSYQIHSQIIHPVDLNSILLDVSSITEIIN